MRQKHQQYDIGIPQAWLLHQPLSHLNKKGLKHNTEVDITHPPLRRTCANFSFPDLL